LLTITPEDLSGVALKIRNGRSSARGYHARNPYSTVPLIPRVLAQAPDGGLYGVALASDSRAGLHAGATQDQKIAESRTGVGEISNAEQQNEQDKLPDYGCAEEPGGASGPDGGVMVAAGTVSVGGQGGELKGFKGFMPTGQGTEELGAAFDGGTSVV
jgi:hypothetical protein